jgi:4-hydroxybenzoate polyprenyltransferase
MHLFLYQIKKFKTDNSEMCLKLFKSNNFLGFIIFGNILLGKIL